jgi:hypothetical protein
MLRSFSVVPANQACQESMALVRDLRGWDVDDLYVDAIDWAVRDDVRAKIRSTIKRLLAKHGYPRGLTGQLHPIPALD